jgi:hypothetical protein
MSTNREEKIFVKIVGARRTCTNYVTRLINENFENINFLSQSKHTPLDEYQKWLNDDPRWHFRTGLRDDLTYILDDRWSGKHDGLSKYNLGDIGCDPVFFDKKEIQSAYLDGRVKVIVCIKNPYSWILSHSKWRGGNLPNSINLEDCVAYNEFYLPPLLENIMDNSSKMIIKAEDCLYGNKDHIKNSLESFLGIESKNNDLVDFDENVATRDGNSTLDRSHYSQWNFLADLKLGQIFGIGNVINWEIFKNYGYEKINLVGTNQSNQPIFKF